MSVRPKTRPVRERDEILEAGDVDGCATAEIRSGGYPVATDGNKGLAGKRLSPCFIGRSGRI